VIEKREDSCLPEAGILPLNFISKIQIYFWRHIMKTKSAFIRDQTGDGYIDVAIFILIFFSLIASFLAIFPIF